MAVIEQSAPGYLKTSDIQKEVPAVARMESPLPKRNPGVWAQGKTPLSQRKATLYGRGPSRVRVGDYGGYKPLPDLSANPNWWQQVASVFHSMPRGEAHAFSPWVGTGAHSMAGIRPRGQPQMPRQGIQQAIPLIQQTMRQFT